MQRSIGNRATSRVLAREWAREPTVADPAPVALNAGRTTGARNIDQIMFTDAAEIGVIRDVLGIDAAPAVVDDDFVGAVAVYQSNYGLGVDGVLGPRTSRLLSQEIDAEMAGVGEHPGDLRRVSRRLHLRSMVTRTSGRLVHQGFVGSDAFPEGAVTVRFDDAGNNITLEYTGENSDSVNWLQMIGGDLSATPAAGGAVAHQVGTQATTGGAVAWGNAATTNWSVDVFRPVGGAQPASPFYDLVGAANRAAGSSIEMLDTPGGAGWVGVAQAFGAPGALAAGATSVNLQLRFSTYVVRNNVARYRVDYTANSTINLTTGAVGAITYRGGRGRPVAGLAAEHHTGLTSAGNYPGSPIH
jgi:hypothetical protein